MKCVEGRFFHDDDDDDDDGIPISALLMVESNFLLAPFQVVGQALHGPGGVCAAPRAGAAFRSTFGLAPKSRPGEVETLCLEIPNT